MEDVVQGEAQQGHWGPPGAVPGEVLELGYPFASKTILA